jgi:hypothetical protein
MDKHLEIINELGSIMRGEHPNWYGNTQEQAAKFLREFQRDMPSLARQLAHDIQRNTSDFSIMSGIDIATLNSAVRVLLGTRFDLEPVQYIERRTPRTMAEAFGKSTASISGPYKRTYDLPVLAFVTLSLLTVAIAAVISW